MEKCFNFILSLSVMASCSKRSRIEDCELLDSDSSIGVIEETTGGLDSGEESEFDRLQENESNTWR